MKQKQNWQFKKNFSPFMNGLSPCFELRISYISHIPHKGNLKSLIINYDLYHI